MEEIDVRWWISSSVCCSFTSNELRVIK